MKILPYSLLKPLATAIGIVLFFLLFGCSATSVNEIFFDPEVDRREVDVRRVAIVPNRLPLNLDQQEMWRRRNWETIRSEFERRNFTVIDYHTSVQLFQRSGLPVEDTPETRNKYAEFAETMNVDLIIIPYYGTLFSSRNFLVFNRLNYRTVTTFQIYSYSQNEFIARIDATGLRSVDSGYGILIMLAGSLLATLSQSTDPDRFEETQDLVQAALIAGTLVSLIELIAVLIPAERRWEEAFETSIRSGLAPFFNIYPGPTR